MVHFPGFARARLWIHRAVRRFYQRGFPHSDIPGSKPACGSPRLIAACHVLHRLLLPRHPPCALSSLTIKFTQHRVSAAAQLVAFGSQLLAKPSRRRVNLCAILLIASACALTPAGLKALSIYSPCSYPIYSVVKHRPHWLAPVTA